MFISVLSENIGTIAVILVLLFVSLLIVIRLVKNKKEGRSSCGCGCSNCPIQGKCHTPKVEKETVAEKSSENQELTEPCEKIMK